MSLEGTLLVSEYKANSNNNNRDNGRHHYFAICRACFWTATLLRTKRIADNVLNPCCNDFENPNLNCLILLTLITA